MKKTGLKGVDVNLIDTINILNIHQYFMKGT